MDLYILDSLLRRTEIIDDFESLIWTERWNSLGDFELLVKSSLQTRSDFYPGTLLATNNSNRVMVVEGTEDTTEGGEQRLKVTGRSLESILQSRTAQDDLSDVSGDPIWILNGTPVEVAEDMFDYVVRNANNNALDAIPYLQPGSMYPAGTIPEPTDVLRWEQRPMTLYQAIRNLCISYDLGFRLVRKPDTSELYFDVYPGNDLTAEVGKDKAVIFSPALGTLENVREYKNTKDYRNVAYVHSEMGTRTVYAPEVDATIDGLQRKVLYLNVDFDTVSPPSNVQDALEQAGQEELARRRKIYLFDGQVPANHPYTYGVDYEVGDLVEVRNRDGVVSFKRVSEQIFVCDKEGERAYPTLAYGTFFGEDDWLSWTDDDTTWADMTTQHWEDM